MLYSIKKGGGYAPRKVKDKRGKQDYMGIVELFLTAVGLSMDAFAVSLCKGLKMPRLSWKHAFIIGAFFGGFQALMPLLGWVLGTQFEHLITNIDHWIVFALLVFIGGKMIWEAVKGDGDEDCDCKESALGLRELIVLAVATSIDALAVGISFAFLDVKIVPAVLLIGVTTFVLSVAGVAIGNKFGVKYKKRAEIAGGMILVLLGVKILLEHLGVIG